MPVPKRESKTARRERTHEILNRLRAAYPASECSLAHDSPFQLLVATVLSAQCTDARVNGVTPALFRRYPTPEALARADSDELEGLIRSHRLFPQQGPIVARTCGRAGARARQRGAPRHGRTRRPARCGPENGECGTRRGLGRCGWGGRGYACQADRAAARLDTPHRSGKGGAGSAAADSPRRAGRLHAPDHRSRQSDLRGAQTPLRRVYAGGSVSIGCALTPNPSPTRGEGENSCNYRINANQGRIPRQGDARFPGDAERGGSAPGEIPKPACRLSIFPMAPPLPRSRWSRAGSFRTTSRRSSD